jgi:hypothetical protein
MTIELQDGDGHKLWQQSMFVAWYDRRRGVGGAHPVAVDGFDRRETTGRVVVTLSEQGELA